jgi:hypothetical protein
MPKLPDVNHGAGANGAVAPTTDNDKLRRSLLESARLKLSLLPHGSSQPQKLKQYKQMKKIKPTEEVKMPPNNIAPKPTTKVATASLQQQIQEVEQPSLSQLALLKRWINTNLFVLPTVVEVIFMTVSTLILFAALLLAYMQ